jgi:hypothetical protein
MKINYHRISGKIGMSDFETGDRGAWLEKRRGLWTFLRAAGHEVNCCSLPTKPSIGLWNPPAIEDKSQVDLFAAAGETLPKADILMLEFGGSNGLFFGKDLHRTRVLIEAHKGKIVFICDDPDLFFPWKDYPNEDWSRWSAWLNAVEPSEEAMKLPKGCRAYDFPFSALLPYREPLLEGYSSNFVYSGRPNGRKAQINTFQFASGGLVDVYGRQEEWSEYGVTVSGGSPKQSERHSFYQTKLGCLAISDSKHKRLRWRTGRAYHALHSGCPVACEDGAEGIQFAQKVSSFDSLKALRECWQSPADRATVLSLQLSLEQGGINICNATLKELGK